jgi:hypothetical protein
MTRVTVGGGSRISQTGTLRPTGTYAGEFDPSVGLPTTGTGRGGAILKGDYWKASGTGTIASLEPFTDFEEGDFLFAGINNAADVGDFFGNKASGGGGGGGDLQESYDNGDGTILIINGKPFVVYGAGGGAFGISEDGSLSLIFGDALATFLVGDFPSGTYQLITNTSIVSKGNIIKITTATALTDAASIAITLSHHTLTTASSRTFTRSYTGDSFKIAITLNATSATFTLPSGDKGIYNGTPSGTNTLVVTGATSGDRIIVVAEKMGTTYTWIGRNEIR